MILASITKIDSNGLLAECARYRSRSRAQLCSQLSIVADTDFYSQKPGNLPCLGDAGSQKVGVFAGKMAAAAARPQVGIFREQVVH